MKIKEAHSCVDREKNKYLRFHRVLKRLRVFFPYYIFFRLDFFLEIIIHLTEIN